MRKDLLKLLEDNEKASEGKLKNAIHSAEKVKFEEPEIDATKNENSFKQVMIHSKLDNMFIQMREGRNRLETRTGLHASAVIAGDSDFCYRQQVLSLIYKMQQGKELPTKALRIFAAGESIHEKWQNMFDKCSGTNGIKLIKNEARSFDKRYNLLFTPDSIVEIDGTLYVVEYKSMNTFSFQKTDPKNPHPSARKQIMLYMFLKGIRNGLIVMEDKNTQDFKISLVRFDYNEVIKYIDRLYEIKSQYKDLLNEDIWPNKSCKKFDSKRACNCSMRDACFFEEKREKIDE